MGDQRHSKVIIPNDNGLPSALHLGYSRSVLCGPKDISMWFELVVERTERGYWLLQTVAWLGLAVITIGSYWFLPRDPAIKVQYFLNVALQYTVSISLAVVCTLCLRTLCRFVWEHQRFLIPGVIFCGVLAASFGVACQFVAERILNAFGVVMPLRSFSRIAARSQFVVTALVCWVALNFAMKFYSRAREQARIMQQSRLAARDAQLTTLRHQFEPHFLLNALNAVSSLIVSEQSQLASVVLSELKALMQDLVTDQTSFFDTLATELEFAEHYLRIQRVRFGNKLDLTINVAPEALPIAVPRRFLLSLIENAVKYSLGDGTSRPISLTVSLTGQTLMLVLENAIADANAVRAVRGLGIGLSHARDLLRNLYGDLATLEIEDDAARFCLRITLPIVTSIPSFQEARTFTRQVSLLDSTLSNVSGRTQ